MSRTHALIPRHTALNRAQTIVSYLTPEEVRALVAAAAPARKGERDGLLIRLLFETGLRISEALALTVPATSDIRPTVALLRAASVNTVCYRRVNHSTAT